VSLGISLWVSVCHPTSFGGSKASRDKTSTKLQRTALWRHWVMKVLKVGALDFCNDVALESIVTRNKQCDDKLLTSKRYPMARWMLVREGPRDLHRRPLRL